MKSVLLNEQGYTTDGQWRLVKVDPTNNGSGSMADEGAMVLKYHPDTPAMNNRTAIARAVFKAMIAASPAPVLAEAATPGPWEVAVWTCGVRGCEVKRGIDRIGCDLHFPNAAYIASANPATILALIARLEAAEAELARLQKTIDVLMQEVG